MQSLKLTYARRRSNATTSATALEHLFRNSAVF
jgi:hypothetical protein